MKNKILIMLVIVLSISTIYLSTILIYRSKNYYKIPKEIKCESQIKEDEENKTQQILILKVDGEQYIESYKNTNLIYYLDDEKWELIKGIKDTDIVSYKFDDNKKILYAEYKEDQLKNGDGTKSVIWYKEYTKALENNGFTCSVIK